MTYFRVRCKDYFETLRPSKSDVPQGSVIGPIIYVIYTADLPAYNDTIISTFADVILAVNDDLTIAATQLQNALN